MPDVDKQAYVFAKGILQDAGFAWRLGPGARGFAPYTVISQSPAPGTRVVDTGAPLVTLRLGGDGGLQGVEARARRGLALRGHRDPARRPGDERDADRAEAGRPEDEAQGRAEAGREAEPSAKAKAKVKAAKRAPAVATRKPDFVVPGARKEPANEMPLTVRARRLDAWVKAHPGVDDAVAKHWLYQNSWIVTGARLGWWHGAQALQMLIAVDERAQRQWGIGTRSAAEARAALGFVRSQRQ